MTGVVAGVIVDVIIVSSSSSFDGTQLVLRTASGVVAGVIDGVSAGVVDVLVFPLGVFDACG